MSKDNKVPWNSWSEIPEELRNSFEREIKQNNQNFADGLEKILELTDEAADEMFTKFLQDPDFVDRFTESLMKGKNHGKS